MNYSFQRNGNDRQDVLMGKWGERRDLNPRPLEPQSRALPTELRPPYFYVFKLKQTDSGRF